MEGFRFLILLLLFVLSKHQISGNRFKVIGRTEAGVSREFSSQNVEGKSSQRHETIYHPEQERAREDQLKRNHEMEDVHTSLSALDSFTGDVSGPNSILGGEFAYQMNQLIDHPMNSDIQQYPEVSSYLDRILSHDSDKSLPESEISNSGHKPSMIDDLVDYTFQNEIPINLDKHSLMKTIFDSDLDFLRPAELERSPVFTDLSQKNLPETEIQSREKSYDPLKKLEQIITGPSEQKSNSVKKPSLQPEIGESSHNLPADSTSVIELLPKSNIMVNVQKIKKLISLYHNKPRHLIGALLAELIPSSELITMRVTSRNFQRVPTNIMCALEAYVAKVAKPQLTSSQFKKSVSNSLTNFRRFKNKKDIDLDHVKQNSELAKKSQVFNNLPAASSDFVPLLPQHGVMIRKNELVDITREFKDQPRILLAHLIEKLIPMEILKTLSAKGSRKFKPFPRDIYEAVKDYINIYCAYHLDDHQFETALENRLRFLRSKDRNNKIIARSKNL